jgi:hypothetical protein
MRFQSSHIFSTSKKYGLRNVFLSLSMLETARYTPSDLFVFLSTISRPSGTIERDIAIAMGQLLHPC